MEEVEAIISAARKEIRPAYPFTIKNMMSRCNGWVRLRSAADNDLLVNGLRKAGLPE
ncbi:MAG: hypothetical protein OES46_18810 [Gammaproteobacteria bacterium]|jgi:hypothetical protein|nr:hypothetical protein [Gammaproteobacteria bacterium]